MDSAPPCQVLFMPVVSPTGSRRRQYGVEGLCNRPRELRKMAPPKLYRHDLATAEAVLRHLAQPRPRHQTRPSWGSFNLTTYGLTQPDLVDQLRWRLAQYPTLRKGALCIEILEHDQLRVNSALVNRLGELCKLGVAIALDDLGCGYFADPAYVRWLLGRIGKFISKAKFGPAAWHAVLNQPRQSWGRISASLARHSKMRVAETVPPQWLRPLNDCGFWIQSRHLGFGTA